MATEFNLTLRVDPERSRTSATTSSEKGDARRDGLAGLGGTLRMIPALEHAWPRLLQQYRELVALLGSTQAIADRMAEIRRVQEILQARERFQQAVALNSLSIANGLPRTEARPPGWRYLVGLGGPTIYPFEEHPEERAMLDEDLPASTTDQPVVPPSVSVPLTANPHADLVLLRGWAEILGALGIENERRMQRRIREYSRRFGGPIRRDGWPAANRGVLIAWWKGIQSKADDHVPDGDPSSNQRQETLKGWEKGVQAKRGRRSKKSPGAPGPQL